LRVCEVIAERNFVEKLVCKLQPHWKCEELSNRPQTSNGFGSYLPFSLAARIEPALKRGFVQPGKFSRNFAQFIQCRTQLNLMPSSAAR